MQLSNAKSVFHAQERCSYRARKERCWILRADGYACRCEKSFLGRQAQVVKNKNRHALIALSIRQNVEKHIACKTVFHRPSCGKCGKPIFTPLNNHRIFRHFGEFSTFSTTPAVENLFLPPIVHIAQDFQKTEINGVFWLLFLCFTC